MTAWTSDELTRIGSAEELQIASRRGDGSLARPRTIWVVRQYRRYPAGIVGSVLSGQARDATLKLVPR